jgi:hypothetical protein
MGGIFYTGIPSLKDEEKKENINKELDLLKLLQDPVKLQERIFELEGKLLESV